MPTSAFISYSHADEKMLDRLHKHLVMLQRDNILSTWSDHQILAGGKLASDISAQLEKSGIFLALLSPDYLASNYCYEKEFAHALALAEANRIRIIPIILEPCDWLASPFSQFMALPKDGKAVTEWTNQNNAFLNIVTELRRLISSVSPSPETGISSSQTLGRRPRIKQDFDSIQKSDFVDKSFNTIKDYFEACCKELSAVGDNLIKAKFELMSGSAFTCTVVNRTKRDNGESHITIRNSKQRGHFGDISYVNRAHADDGSSNGSIRVQADDYNLYLVMDNFSYSSRGEPKLSPEQVAEKLWVEFVKQAGVDYE